MHEFIESKLTVREHSLDKTNAKELEVDEPTAEEGLRRIAANVIHTGEHDRTTSVERDRTGGK